MPDFTLNNLLKIIQSLKDQHYEFQTFAGFLKKPLPRVIILRHDVDNRNINSLQTALLEKDLGINGTFYFRMVPHFNDGIN